MTITVRTFFACSLALPIAVGLLGFAVPMLEGLTWIMTFAALPYLVCAFVLAVLVRFASTDRQLFLLSIAAPWFMGLIMLSFLAAIDPPELRSASRLVELAHVIPLAALVGYCYVGVVWLGLYVARRHRLVDK